MAEARRDSPRGILHGDGEPERFELACLEPSPSLEPFVEYYWSVRWDRTDQPPHEQEILPHPCVQLVVERGLSGVFGPALGKAVKVLSGAGRAFGIKFWPGAFSAITPRPIAELTARSVPLPDVLGDAGSKYEAGVLDAADDRQRVALAESLLAARDLTLEDDAVLARRVVERIARDPEAVRVEDIARAAGVTVRSLQRVFRCYVGLTPKQVVQRYRMHEAVDALEAGERVDFAALAGRLGYFDQAHFTRDFTRVVGRSPARYAREVRGE